MSWTDRHEVRAQLQRPWERGELLRASVRDTKSASDLADSAPPLLFPRRLTLRVPDAQAIGQQFEKVRQWLDDLVTIPHVRIEWRDVRHRVVGQQRLPEQLWIDHVDDACALIEKTAEINLYRSLLNEVNAQQPALAAWVLRYPLRALSLAAQWPHLLAVVNWCQTHPRPGVYLRQMDLPGVHTKFLESHRGVLSEWLDLALPAEAINPEATGIAAFAERYGFLGKPMRIRFRPLDTRLSLLAGAVEPDLTLDAASFAQLQLPVKTVFMTENEVNFLSFPKHDNAIVIFGAGYGWDALARTHWLHRCQVYYWGDIDTHGFAILDQLRAYLPHVQSLMMDQRTLLAHATAWGLEPQPTHRDLPRLTANEQALYDDLRLHRRQSHLRLEQEHLSFAWVENALATLQQPPLFPQ